METKPFDSAVKDAPNPEESNVETKESQIPDEDSPGSRQSRVGFTIVQVGTDPEDDDDKEDAGPPSYYYSSYQEKVIPEPVPTHLCINDANPMVDIIVGPSPDERVSPLFSTTQRTFYIPKSLLSEQSSFFRVACKGPWKEGRENRITLPEDDPRIFASFVDFMRSNIYSVNTQAVGFQFVLFNAMAWVLGDKLGAFAFRDAALRKLHCSFYCNARIQGSHANISPISATDIDYVCTHTLPHSNLRALFFDAVAAHWTQVDVVNIAHTMDVDDDEVSWPYVYNTYDDFRRALEVSARYIDIVRSVLLADVQEYLTGRIQVNKTVEEVSGSAPERKKSTNLWGFGNLSVKKPEKQDDGCEANDEKEVQEKVKRGGFMGTSIEKRKQIKKAPDTTTTLQAAAEKLAALAEAEDGSGSTEVNEDKSIATKDVDSFTVCPKATDE